MIENWLQNVTSFLTTDQFANEHKFLSKKKGLEQPRHKRGKHTQTTRHLIIVQTNLFAGRTSERAGNCQTPIMQNCRGCLIAANRWELVIESKSVVIGKWAMTRIVKLVANGWKITPLEVRWTRTLARTRLKGHGLGCCWTKPAGRWWFSAAAYKRSRFRCDAARD